MSRSLTQLLYTLAFVILTALVSVHVQAQTLTVRNGNFNTPWGSRPSVVMLNVDVATACPNNVDITVTVEGDGVNEPQFAPGNWGPIYYPGDANKCGSDNGKCGGTLSFSRDAGSRVSSVTFSGIESVAPARDSQDRLIPGWFRYFVAIPANLVPLQVQAGTSVGTSQADQFTATLHNPQAAC